MNNIQNALMAIGLASVVTSAKEKAAVALVKRAEAYAPWEDAPNNLHRTYHTMLANLVQPYLETALEYAVANGYGELKVQYAEGLITSDEFMIKLVDALASEGAYRSL